MPIVQGVRTLAARRQGDQWWLADVAAGGLGPWLPVAGAGTSDLAAVALDDGVAWVAIQDLGPSNNGAAMLIDQPWHAHAGWTQAIVAQAATQIDEGSGRVEVRLLGAPGLAVAMLDNRGMRGTAIMRLREPCR